VALWERLVVPRFRGKRIDALEVGSFEGRSATWALDNVLTHAGSRLWCIDDYRIGDTVWWRGRPVLNPLQRFRDNVRASGAAAKVRLVQRDAAEALRDGLLPARRRPHLSLAYVDAQLNARDCLEYGVLIWPLLLPGGLLIFDDYTDAVQHDARCPRPGIDAFITAYAAELRVLHRGWQAVLMKRAVPLKRPPCRSE
jgi:predicted O-methyltransferase YrrM